MYAIAVKNGKLVVYWDYGISPFGKCYYSWSTLDTMGM